MVKHTLNIAVAMIVAAAPTLNYAAYSPVYENIIPKAHQNDKTTELSLNDFKRIVVYKQGTNEIDVREMARVAMQLQKHYEINTGNYIPASEMPQYSSDGEKVATKILKHTVENWIESNDLDDVAVVRQAQAVTDGLSTDVKLSESKDAGNFKFRLRPITGEAQIRYEGSFAANLSYDIPDSTTRLQISWGF